MILRIFRIIFISIYVTNSVQNLRDTGVGSVLNLLLAASTTGQSAGAQHLLVPKVVRWRGARSTVVRVCLPVSTRAPVAVPWYTASVAVERATEHWRPNQTQTRCP